MRLSPALAAPRFTISPDNKNTNDTNSNSNRDRDSHNDGNTEHHNILYYRRSRPARRPAPRRPCWGGTNLSHDTCLIRPRLFSTPFVVSRITMACRILRHL